MLEKLSTCTRPSYVIQTGLGIRLVFLAIPIKWGSKCLSRKHFKLIPILLQAIALECVLLANVQKHFVMIPVLLP